MIKKAYNGEKLKKYTIILISLSFLVLLSLFSVKSFQIKDKIKFVVFSDPHLELWGVNSFKMGKYSVEIVEKLVEHINTMKDIDFVLIPGDLLSDGEPWNLDLLKSILDRLKVPYYVTLGNHDMSVGKKAKEGKYPPGITKMDFVLTFWGHGYNDFKTYYSVDPVPGLHLIVLDSAVPAQLKWGGHIPEEQLKWLEGELAANSGKINIVVVHHNLVAWHPDEEKGGPEYKNYDWFMADNAEEVRKILEKYYPSCQIVISGHRHIGLRYKNINGINYFVVPSTVSYPNMYVIFEIEGNKVRAWEEWIPVDRSWIEEAKKNLLGEPGMWWRPSDCLPPGPETDKKLLEFFEGPYHLKVIELTLKSPIKHVVKTISKK